jgi:hypothetical protein
MAALKVNTAHREAPKRPRHAASSTPEALAVAEADRHGDPEGHHRAQSQLLARRWNLTFARGPQPDAHAIVPGSSSPAVGGLDNITRRSIRSMRADERGGRYL